MGDLTGRRPDGTRRPGFFAGRLDNNNRQGNNYGAFD
jgi:hypothetical protein